MIASRRCWRVIGLLLLVGAAQAEPGREQSLAEMDHKTWTARDGAPQGINALAQGADGTLWIGSDSGLFNFDGRTFTPFQSPVGETDFPVDAVRTLYAARDGTLWAGFFDAGVARIRHGRVTVYPTVDGNRLRVMDDLREASDGSIWGVSAQNRIVRFAGQRWREEPQPLATGQGIFAFLDSFDTLWVSQGGRLYRRDIRETRYTATSVAADWMFGFAEAPDRTFWIADYDGSSGDARLQHVDRLGSLIGTVPSIADWAPYEIVRRPDGSLIYASQFDGLRLLSADSLSGAGRTDKNLRPEAFTQRQGLTSDVSKALLRDADGTLWVGGPAGLDRFRTGSFIPFGTEQMAGDGSVCANERGEVWVAHRGGNLYRIAGGKTKVFPEPEAVSTLFCGSDGHTWLVNRTGVWDAHGEQMTAVPSIPGLATYSISTIVVAPDHTLFATVGGNESAGGGAWQYRQGQWTKFADPALRGKTKLVMYVDRQDRLWLGLRDEVGRPTLTGGEFLSAPGLGLVYAFLDTTRGFLAAGAGGLAVQRGSHFEMLAFEDRTFTSGLNGLVEARNGDLWLNASRGVIRVPGKELQAALVTPSYRMKSELVTEGDLAGVTLTLRSYPTAARDVDGKLWFVTRRGVFHLDPQQHTSDIRPPIVSIRSIAADRIPLGDERTFAARPQTLEIRYFGAHLTDPERVTYRYRLAGLEGTWQDAGRRTEALYTRLGPGTYTFHVMASSGNDVWTTPVSSETFVVLPSFYQTGWFRVSCIVVALALMFGIFTLRVRALTRAIRARAEERADERIRIARELHDTLLQGVQGLLLNFHVAAQKLAPDDASKTMLERTLSTADRIIVEGRNRVSSLRSEQLTDSELVAALENAGNDLRPGADVQFTVTRSGIAATLTAHVADEIFWIAREALSNAFRHAGASRIRMELNYGARYFSMMCADDGRGFDAGNGEKQGHWGLRGMTERARKLGGHLHVQSDPASGTQITASVPSYRAYRNHSRFTFYLRALQFN